MRGVNPCKLNQIIMMSYLVMNMISRLTWCKHSVLNHIIISLKRILIIDVLQAIKVRKQSKISCFAHCFLFLRYFLA
jgi:hypothetical protein